MPLHLLGKKSWHVYNTANVERVRRDEADAHAREEAEEQRMQEEDAARRTAILRGESVLPLLENDEGARLEDSVAEDDRRRWSRGAGQASDIVPEVVPDSVPDGAPRERKRKRLRGEDDTEREIRYAREDAEVGGRAKRTLSQNGGKKRDDAPLIDRDGHLQLIPVPDDREVRKAEKNAELEAEKAKKRKRDEDQYTMRFSNAAGFNNSLESPWYASNKRASANPITIEDGNTLQALLQVAEKDVWGNEDPRRKDRERNRITSSDPFAAMQQAQRQLKQSSKDRERSQRERMTELADLEKQQKRDRRRRRQRSDEEDGLEDFSLDAPAEGSRREQVDRGTGTSGADIV